MKYFRIRIGIILMLAALSIACLSEMLIVETMIALVSALVLIFFEAMVESKAVEQTKADKEHRLTTEEVFTNAKKVADDYAWNKFVIGEVMVDGDDNNRQFTYNSLNQK